MDIKEVERQMHEVYKDYPIIGDYDINPEIFEPEILELIKYSIEDED
jgi:hypothetical protein